MTKLMKSGYRGLGQRPDILRLMEKDKQQKISSLYSISSSLTINQPLRLTRRVLSISYFSLSPLFLKQLRETTPTPLIQSQLLASSCSCTLITLGTTSLSSAQFTEFYPLSNFPPFQLCSASGHVITSSVHSISSSKQFVTKLSRLQKIIKIYIKFLI